MDRPKLGMLIIIGMCIVTIIILLVMQMNNKPQTCTPVKIVDNESYLKGRSDMLLSTVNMLLADAKECKATRINLGSNASFEVVYTGCIPPQK